jgi:hypothetical protein
MFNKNLTEVLSQVNSITNSIILRYPTTVAVSESQDVMVSIDVSVLDGDQFPEIGLKDSLSDFLSLFKLFGEDREVSVENNTVSVSSGNNSSCYITDNIALMDAYDKDPEQFVKTEQAPSVASFDLAVDDIKNIKSATGVFKDLTEVLFTSIDGDMKVSLGATNKFNAKSNTYSVTKGAQTSKEFEIKIPVENFKMLPVSDYTVDVKYNSARDSYRVMLSSNSLDGFKIIMSVKV